MNSECVNHIHDVIFATFLLKLHSLLMSQLKAIKNVVGIHF